MLPVDREKLEESIDMHWHEWDPDGGGTITCKEFLFPKTGLKDYVVKHMKELKGRVERTTLSNTP